MSTEIIRIFLSFTKLKTQNCFSKLKYDKNTMYQVAKQAHWYIGSSKYKISEKV